MACRLHERPFPFQGLPSCAGDIGLDRDAVGDTMEPAAQRVVDSNRAGLPGKDQEGCLERILGVVRAAEDAAADGQDHGAVAGDQGGEGGLVSPGGEPLQQLGVRQAAGRSRAEEGLEVPQDGPESRTSHDRGVSLEFVAFPPPDV